MLLPWADVRLLEVNPQGYGAQMVFDDGHQQGIYPWAYLRELVDRLGMWRQSI